MLFEWKRLGVVALVAGVVAGCGGGASSGGSGGGGTGGGGNSTTVTFSFEGATPTAVATQVGSGAFQTVTPAASVSLTLPSGTTKFAVAYVCPAVMVNSSTGQVLTTGQDVFEATTTDGTSFSGTCGMANWTGTTGTLTFGVDASAINGASEISVQAENSQYYAQAPYELVASNATLAAPVGTDRVDIEAWGTTGSGFQYLLTTYAAKTLTGQSVPGSLNGGNTVVLGAEDLVTMEPITFNGTPSGFSGPFVTADYLPTGEAGSFLLTYGAATEYPGLPAGVTQGGGSYDVQAEAIAVPNATAAVTVLQRFSSAGPVTVNFPAVWTYPGPSAAALPTFNFDYTGFAGKSGVSQTGEIGWLTGQSTEMSYFVKSSASYQGSSASMTMPNLTSLPGFLAPPASGTSVFWVAAVSQSDTGSLQPVSGSMTESTATAEGSFTVP